MEPMPIDRIIWRVQQHYLDMKEFRLADAYKLVYQGCMGPEHAIADPEVVRQWLAREWSELEPSTREGLYTDITIHRPIYRLNLRAAKAMGIAQERILKEFIGLASIFPKEPLLLRSIWKEISQQIKSGRELVHDPQNLDVFNREILKNDFPAVHHSEEYGKANRPAYRLVDKIIG